MEFKDKVVVITGGSGGIGSATAEIFAENGAKLVLIGTSSEKTEKKAKELGLKEGEYLALGADVSKEADVKAYVDATVDKFGRIDVFFNNAGVSGDIANTADISSENMEKIYGVNIMGVHFGLKHVLKVMLKQKSGSIINTSSLAGLRGFPGLGAYVASKHAVVGLTRTAALEVAGEGVRVNAICPAPVETRMMDTIEKDMGEGARENFEAGVPMKRYGKREEIARLVYFLASDKASFITGGIYTIDGGQSAKA
ncbi:SDR family NAD(P)-dependent oxidoreductase [Dethiobacter alkaliphilus]|uniref:SDR family NAD(P)-dependent oxidoreductase n=1 Tax=Dethiobacter alkaliphilus TaxID=427926 RepID=UPI0022266E63|nr:glucose 1-dehydrogenase [Dethiobacter alkaliphilus]MCW3488534.1 glucose 1-dehydrogenase [Dethiobacter alkaliphilus]